MSDKLFAFLITLAVIFGFCIAAMTFNAKPGWLFTPVPVVATYNSKTDTLTLELKWDHKDYRGIRKVDIIRLVEAE